MLVKDAAKTAADQVLAKHWGGELPVNPVAIAESLGISVSFGDLADDLSGAIVADQGEVNIYLSESESLSRQIFTCAHELGHYFERQLAEDAEYSFSDNAESSESSFDGRGGPWDLHEFYADEFAGNLLMPATKFIELYKQNVGVGTLADIFAVSRAAVQARVRRLRKDGLLEARPR